MARSASIAGQGGAPAARRRSRSAISRSARCRPARKTQRCPSSVSATTSPASSSRPSAVRDQLLRHLQQLARERHELLLGQAAVPLLHGLGEREGDAGAHPDHGRALDAELGGDLVGGAEADAADVAGQPVGVLGDDPHRVRAVGLVDAHRPRGADAVRVQEQHDLADHLLLRPAGDDARGPLRADAGDLAQAVRLLLDQVEHRFAEGAHQLLGVDGPMPRIMPEPRYFSMPSSVVGARRLQEGGPELQAVGAVVHPHAGRADELARRDQGGVADHGGEVALAAHLDAQHAEAGLGVVEGDPLDQARQDLGRGRGRRAACSVHAPSGRVVGAPRTPVLAAYGP